MSSDPTVFKFVLRPTLYVSGSYTGSGSRQLLTVKWSGYGPYITSKTIDNKPLINNYRRPEECAWTLIIGCKHARQTKLPETSQESKERHKWYTSCRNKE